MVEVILPVLNESLALPGVLAGLPSGYDPLVVDNGSTDGSGDLARSLGAHVVLEPQRGFGAACWAGLVAARADVICFMDCDASMSGADLVSVVAPIDEGRAEMVLGRRRPVERGVWPRHARVANQLLAYELGRRSGVVLKDLGPMRAARRVDLLGLGLADRRFGWPLEMVLKAARAGWRIEEVDVAYLPRQGRSKVTGTLRGTLQTVRDMSAVLR